MCVYMRGCVCVCVCVRVCECVCMMPPLKHLKIAFCYNFHDFVYECACVCECVSVCAKRKLDCVPFRTNK